MEYLRTNNLVQAQEFLKQASGLCPMDPLIFNELGSIFYKQKDFVPAIEMFSKALEICQGLPEERRARSFDQAIYYIQCALRLSPRNVASLMKKWSWAVGDYCQCYGVQASTLAALSFTYHMKGALEQAIEFYHSVGSSFFFHAPTLVDVHEALAYTPENTLAGSMITVAFEEALSGGPGSFPEFADPPQKKAPKTSGLTPLTNHTPAPLSRRLDETYKSMETSALSPSSSDLDLSQDSSMMNLDDD
ncbi:hypothetical protein PsorP6_002360 [Peronosclerospora sorghi]|uniref:Uncharacterized protein n=1 Tax=Peronosclerospora sorghi TaxID=230839 RepID=A0ACC0WTF4_9STRA|nr:hypothetical protein PsorP6_002360 [Peronosclerospora sorghi]